MDTTTSQKPKKKREVLRVESLTDADLAAIADAEPPADTRHLDRELE